MKFFYKDKNYQNPNKFIIKKNNFLRDFKSLYKKIDDPWNQKKNFNIDQSIIILDGLINYINNKYKKINILDIGAGSGVLKKKFNKKFKYLGTDINNKKYKHFIFDDINIYNLVFKNKFDLIFCLKTIYYVSDNINKVLLNLSKYLKKNGIIIITYNFKKDSFSNKYLNDLKLKKMMLKRFKEILTIEINRQNYEKFNEEKITILIFQKVK